MSPLHLAVQLGYRTSGVKRNFLKIFHGEKNKSRSHRKTEITLHKIYKPQENNGARSTSRKLLVSRVFRTHILIRKRSRLEKRRDKAVNMCTDIYPH